MCAWEIAGGRIWTHGGFKPNSVIACHPTEEADRRIELMDEDLILPGLVDFHAHLWSPASVSPLGVQDGRFFADGVVAAVDCGTVGWRDWQVADRYWRAASRLKIRSFMHLLPEGLTVYPPVDSTPVEAIDPADVMASMRNDTHGTLMGLKVQLGFVPHADEAGDRAMLRLARGILDEAGGRLMVHPSKTFLALDEVVSFMRPGDILTHVYNGFRNGVVGPDGRVNDAVLQAREQGVVLDVGHAVHHFSFDVFRKAYDAGLRFDVLGGDMIEQTYKEPRHSMIFDLAHIVSSFLALGVDRDELFHSVTSAPARLMGVDLDLTHQTLILKHRQGGMPMSDGLGGRLALKSEYRPWAFISDGAVVLMPCE